MLFVDLSIQSDDEFLELEIAITQIKISIKSISLVY